MISATQDRNFSLSSGGSLRQPPLLRRAAMAVVLVASFWVLATALVSGLFWMAYADTVGTQGGPGVPGRLLFWVAATAVVLWAILPRPDRFEPPGPSISARDEPALFAAIAEVARNTGQEAPTDVYLVNDVTASVTSRGGLMGFGSRRVVVVGLPLMQAVSVQELKAILAHEFGHYHAGDVPLGPWVHKTRTAIGRTMQRLGQHLPAFALACYGDLFLRVTRDVCRSQEIVADAVAARAAGGAAMISALRTVHATSIAYRSYMQQELKPVLERGFLPPVGAGFMRYLDTPGMTAYLGAVLQYETAQPEETDALDTHPSFLDRITTLNNLPQGSAGDTRRASSLLTDSVKWEHLAVRTSAAPDWPACLEPVGWNQVVHAVYMPLWRARVDSHGHLLRTHTIGTLPTTTAEFVKLGSMLVTRRDEAVTDRTRLDRAGQLILAAIAVRLAALGWSVEALPGDETILRFNGAELRPYSELRAVLDGRVPASHWRERCASLGIADAPLWGAPPVAGVSAHDSPVTQL